MSKITLAKEEENNQQHGTAKNKTICCSTSIITQQASTSNSSGSSNMNGNSNNGNQCSKESEEDVLLITNNKTKGADSDKKEVILSEKRLADVVVTSPTSGEHQKEGETAEQRQQQQQQQALSPPVTANQIEECSTTTSGDNSQELLEEKYRQPAQQDRITTTTTITQQDNSYKPPSDLQQVSMSMEEEEQQQQLLLLPPQHQERGQKIRSKPTPGEKTFDASSNDKNNNDDKIQTDISNQNVIVSSSSLPTTSLEQEEQTSTTQNTDFTRINQMQLFNIVDNQSQEQQYHNNEEAMRSEMYINNNNNIQQQTNCFKNSNKGFVGGSKASALILTDTERRYRPQKYCAVCGDKAIACNFNAVTCESCKAFFRRNAFKEQRLKCLFDNRCIIDRVTRRFCSKCRLLKCFNIGMKREWILTDEQKQIKRVKILQNKQSKQHQESSSSSTSSSSSSNNQHNQINNNNYNNTMNRGETTNVVSPNNTDDSSNHLQFMSPTTCSTANDNNNNPRATNLMLPIISMTNNSDQHSKQEESEGYYYSNNNDNNKHDNNYKQSRSIKLQSRQQPVSLKLNESRSYANGANGYQSFPKYKDASTSCPDESELLNPLSRTIHYCSMTTECHYCSLRLTSSSSNNTANNSIIQYRSHPINSGEPTILRAEQEQQQQHSGMVNYNQHTINNQQHQQQPLQIRVGLPPYNAVSGPTQLHSLSSYAHEQQRSALNIQTANGRSSKNMSNASGACCFMEIEQQSLQHQLVQFNHHHTAAPSQDHSMNHHEQQQQQQLNMGQQLTMQQHQISIMNNHQSNDVILQHQHQQQQTPHLPQLHVMTPTQVAQFNSNHTPDSNHLFSASSQNQQQLHNQQHTMNNNDRNQQQMIHTGSQYISLQAATNDQYNHQAGGCDRGYHLEASSTNGSNSYVSQQYAPQQSRNINPFVMALEVSPLHNFTNEVQQVKSSFLPVPSPEMQSETKTSSQPSTAMPITASAKHHQQQVQSTTSSPIDVQQTTQQQQTTSDQEPENYNIYENNTTTSSTTATTTSTTTTTAAAADITSSENKTVHQKTNILSSRRGSIKSNNQNDITASPGQIESIISNTDSCASEELAYVLTNSPCEDNNINTNYNNPPSSCSEEVSPREQQNPTTSLQQLAMNGDMEIHQQKSSEFVLWNGEIYHEPADTESEMKSRVEKLDFSDHERLTIYESIEATRFIFENANSQDNHKPSSTLNEIVYFCDAALRRLIKTVKQIKGFRMLSMDDQIVLLKTACFKILLLRSTYHYIPDIEGWCDSKSGKIMRLDFLKRAKKSLVYEKHRDLVKRIPEPLRRDRFIMAIMSLALLFDPHIDLKHSNSVGLDNLLYLSILRKYLIQTQPDPLTKYEYLSVVLQLINVCNEEYNVFFSKDFQPEQITPLLIEIFDISLDTNCSMES